MDACAIPLRTWVDHVPETILTLWPHAVLRFLAPLFLWGPLFVWLVGKHKGFLPHAPSLRVAILQRPSHAELIDAFSKGLTPMHSLPLRIRARQVGVQRHGDDVANLVQYASRRLAKLP